MSSTTNFIVNGLGDLSTIFTSWDGLSAQAPLTNYKYYDGTQFQDLSNDFQPLTTSPGSSYTVTGFKVYNYTPLWTTVTGTYDLGQIFSNIPTYTTTGTPVLSINNNYTYLTFLNNGSITFNKSVNFYYLAIGGGGGSTFAGSGGGGGGISLNTTPFSATENSTYNLTVGSGGFGTSETTGLNGGGNSEISGLSLTVISYGGKCGESISPTNPYPYTEGGLGGAGTYQTGGNGGIGQEFGSSTGGNGQSIGTITLSPSNNITYYVSNGGGGIGGSGNSSTNPGNGGSGGNGGTGGAGGSASGAIYAGGSGGGGGYNGQKGNASGAGYGGNGGYVTPTTTDSIQSYGNGGGGAGFYTGGSGSKGVIIIWFPN